MLTWLGAGVVVSLRVSAVAQPARVTFSGSGKGTNIVDFSPLNYQRARELERLKQGLGPRLRAEETPELPYVAPSPVRNATSFSNKKLQELLDRRANWIYAGDGSEESLLSSGKGEQGSNITLDPSKPKRAIEKYLDKVQKERKANLEDKKKNRNKSEDDDDAFDPDSAKAKKNSPLDVDFRAGVPWRSNDSGSKTLDSKTATFDGGSPADNNPLFASPDAGTSISSSFRSGLLGGREDRLRQERQQASQDWLQLLRTGSPRAGGSAFAPADPLNQVADTTRTPLQPVTGAAPADLDTLGRSRSLSGDIPGAGSPFLPGPSSSFSDLFGPRVFGSASFSSPFSDTAASAPVFTPKPAVLEIPHRKF